jgi:hypothetical protein
MVPSRLGRGKQRANVSPGSFSFSQLSHFLHGPETESLCRAGGHASRFLSFTDKIKARIALLHFPVASKTGHPERADPQTGVASDAFFLVNDDNAIIRAFFYRSSRAGGLASRVPTMHASQRNGPICDIGILTLPDTDYAPPPHSCIEMVQALASQLTGMALNASVCIKIKSKLFGFHTTHLFPDSSGLRIRRSALLDAPSPVTFFKLYAFLT